MPSGLSFARFDAFGMYTRGTAGIDGEVALTSQARAEMAVQVHASIGSHQPSPVRRVFIPKASDKTKMRPLGIPTAAA